MMDKEFLLKEIDVEITNAQNLIRYTILRNARGLLMEDINQLKITDLEYTDLYYRLQLFFINLMYNQPVDMESLTEQDTDLIISSIYKAKHRILLEIFKEDQIIQNTVWMINNSEKQHAHEADTNKKLYEKHKKIFT